MIVHYQVTVIPGPNTRPRTLEFTLWTDKGGTEGECQRGLRDYLELKPVRCEGRSDGQAFKLQSWEVARFDMRKFLSTEMGGGGIA
jgi:hypothetical protein